MPIMGLANPIGNEAWSGDRVRGEIRAIYRQRTCRALCYIEPAKEQHVEIPR
jgi:hypothetical protein